jgi:hypothetical protein
VRGGVFLRSGLVSDRKLFTIVILGGRYPFFEDIGQG